MLNDVEPLLGELGNYVEYIPPLTQEKVVKPSIDMVEVIPDEEYTGLSRVTINGVTSDIDSNIIPENIKLGINILGVDGSVIEKPSDEWGISDARYLFYGNARLDIMDELLGKLKNCTNFYGMFSNASALEECPSFDSSKGTNFSRMFEYCYGLKKVNYFDTSKSSGDFSYMFFYCQTLTEIPQLDTSKATNFSNLFYDCEKLPEIPQLDASNVTNVRQMLDLTNGLTTFGGLKNLGKSYTKDKNANYIFYSLYLLFSYDLTHDSLMNVINNLYDLNINGVESQQLVLGSTNLAKLSSEEIQIATDKNWSVS